MNIKQLMLYSIITTGLWLGANYLLPVLPGFGEIF
jgi:hypothetical protein